MRKRQAAARSQSWLLLVLGITALLMVLPNQVFAQGANDFFSITNNQNQRSTPAAQALPGFNPCPGHTGPDGSSCSVSSGALLSQANLGVSCAETAAGSCAGSLGLFERLGPGSVTDNMFGMITAPADPTRCTPFSSATAGPNGLLLGLNCGDLHFDPTTQGQSVPTQGNLLSSTFISTTSMNADFSPSVDGHTGFDITNTFTWTPGGTGTCGATLPTVCVDLDQSLLQVTNLVPGGAGTLTTPGTGDQVFEVATQFAMQTSGTSLSGPNGSPTPTVTWTQKIVDPEQSGTAATGFTQDLTGSFVYNSPTANFGCGASDQGCSEYPDGRSQTLRSVDPASSVIETLP